MRIPTLALTVAATAVLGLSGVPIASSAPPRCADVQGVVEPGQMCRIQASDTGYSLDIVFPTDFPDEVTLYDYVKQTRDGFLNVAKMPGPQLMPYELDTTVTEYESALPPRETQSVVFKTFQDVGGAHPQTFYKSFNWDETLRKPITIDTFFKAGTSPFEVILPIVQSELEKQSGQLVTIPPGVGLDPSKYQNFAITNDAVIFFFGQGEVLPEAAGALQVSVPRGPIDAMIA